MTKKSQKQQLHTIRRSPGNRGQSCLWRQKFVEFGKIYVLYDVTSNFELDFQAISWSYLGPAFDFSSSFFELFLMGISIKISQIPHWKRVFSVPMFRFLSNKLSGATAERATRPVNWQRLTSESVANPPRKVSVESSCQTLSLDTVIRCFILKLTE